MAWTDLTFAYGSKLTSAKMTQLFDDFQAMATGASGAPSITVVGNAAIAQAKLKTSTGSVNVTGAASNLTLPGGEYGFYPQINCSDSVGFNTQMGGVWALSGAPTSYVTNIYISVGSGYTGYAQQRYVTSSGEVFWIFILRDKATGKILAMWQAPDHPCMGNGGKPLIVPHPFPDFDPASQEIIVVNPNSDELKRIMDLCTVPGEDKPDRDILDVIANEYEIIEKSNPPWPEKEVTVGLPKGHDWRTMAEGSLISPIKKEIPRAEMLICKGMRKKIP